MPKKKVRLDELLVSLGLVESRQRARALILEGGVEMHGRRMEKPGVSIDPESPVTLRRRDHPYVSRGGVKLEGALKNLGVSPACKICLDAGASTGGFTHCLLLHGAARVYAVDVGYGQFDCSLRQDPRVVLYEKTNIRYLRRDLVPEPVQLIVADLSFISLKKVIPQLIPFLSDRGEILSLVKPQFEVGKGKVGKGGVVRDPDRIQEVLRDLECFFRAEGLDMLAVSESVLRGPKGNHEFFFHMRPVIRG